MNPWYHPIKHGQGRRGKQTKAFFSYHDAKRRCTNKNCAGYKNYGGRGIKFLFTSFEEFFKELGPRPANRSLDRINNDGHYEPGNVRWATRSEQMKNQRYRPDRRERMLGNTLFLGRKHSESTIKKMRSCWTVNRKKEWAVQTSKRNLGRHHSEETKAKIGMARRRAWQQSRENQ